MHCCEVAGPGDQEVVEAFPAQRADEALGGRVRPRRLDRCADDSDVGTRDAGRRRRDATPAVTGSGARTSEGGVNLTRCLADPDQLLLVRVPSPLPAAFCEFLIARFSLMDLSDFLLAVCRGDLSDTALAPLSGQGVQWLVRA